MTDPSKPVTPRPPKLRRRFKWAAGGAAGAVALATAGTFAVFGTATGNAPLTPEEAAVAQSLFGPDFRTDDIRKQYVRSWVGGAIQYPAAVVPLTGRHIYFFEPDLRVRDLTLSTDYDFKLYMHEMTHIWQHRGNWAPICKTYDYMLTPQSRFKNYCNEQQASIVGDYAEDFLNPRNVNAIRLLRQGSSTRADNEYLMRVVEGQFPQARASRLNIERKNLSAYRCTVRFNAVIQAAAAPADEETAVIQRCLADPAAQPLTEKVETPDKTMAESIIAATQRLLPLPPQN